MELGIYTFAETTLEAGGRFGGAEQRLKQLIEEIELADQVGLDVFGVGEHHRPDYSVSSPSVVLGAAAARTKRIRLTSAVTVLSSDDPVRVFQDFATIDLLSGGRAEIMAGRGSFIESFPLFGYDLRDYDALFSEKLDLLLRLRDQEKISWRGELRPPIDNLGVYPRPVQHPLPVWIAVGGTPESVVRAGALGLPLALAIIGGEPERFGPLVSLYREAGHRAGHAPDALKVGINSHGFIAESSRQAADIFYPPHAEVMTRIGKERGWPPETRAHFEASRGPRGALLVGSVEEVAEKIVFEHSIFRNDRFLMQMSVGPMPHDKLLRSIELFGTKVAPIVREEVSSRMTSSEMLRPGVWMHLPPGNSRRQQWRKIGLTAVRSADRASTRRTSSTRIARSSTASRPAAPTGARAEVRRSPPRLETAARAQAIRRRTNRLRNEGALRSSEKLSSRTK